MHRFEPAVYGHDAVCQLRSSVQQPSFPKTLHVRRLVTPFRGGGPGIGQALCDLLQAHAAVANADTPSKQLLGIWCWESRPSTRMFVLLVKVAELGRAMRSLPISQSRSRSWQHSLQGMSGWRLRMRVSLFYLCNLCTVISAMQLQRDVFKVVAPVAKGWHVKNDHERTVWVRRGEQRGTGACTCDPMALILDVQALIEGHPRHANE